MQPKAFQQAVLNWFDHHGRHDLPWQQNINHYRVWVSEIMLQQTQVSTVIPYFEKFMCRFPDIVTLANAEQDEVMHHWAGLGYYARARNLHRTAHIIAFEQNGKFPNDHEAMQALPGIGRSTAAAILAIVDRQPLAILDGNVKRVLGRFAGINEWPGKTAVAAQMWQLAEKFTPQKRVNDYTQAMMDLGATLCTRTKPQCLLCPLQGHCQAAASATPERFPGKKPRKEYPIKHAWFAVLKCHDKVLLHKRPNQGIWGGLWVPPQFESQQTCQGWLQSFGIDDNETSNEKIHKFTHYQLNYHEVSADISEALYIADYQWVSPSTVGLPKPFKHLQHLTFGLDDAIS